MMHFNNIYSKLSDILLIAESDIKFFQKTRDDVDSFKRILKSFFNKKVFQQCVKELEIAYDRLSKSNIAFANFYEENKHAFTVDAKRHIVSYSDYLKSAVAVAEKRLMVQRLILDIKVNRTIKNNEIDLPKMFDDLDEMYEECRLKAVMVNKIAEEIKKSNEAATWDC